MKTPRHASLTVLAAAALLGGGLLWAQGGVPQGLIENFRLPLFNNEGFRTWELRGGTGRYLDRNRIELTLVRLQVFSGDESNTVTLQLDTPLAVVQPEDRVVSGPQQIHVVGDGFELFGNDWIYEHGKKTMEIRRDVVVTFKQDIGDILR